MPFDLTQLVITLVAVVGILLVAAMAIVPTVMEIPAPEPRPRPVPAPVIPLRPVRAQPVTPVVPSGDATADPAAA